MLVLCVLTSCLSFVSILDCICHQCLTLIIYHVTSLLVILYLSTVHCVCLFKLFVCIFNFLLPPVVNKDVHCIFTVALGYAIARLGYRRRPSVCPSVRPSVTSRYHVKTNGHMITRLSPPHSPGTLFFRPIFIH